jgi:hypothetical protein
VREIHRLWYDYWRPANWKCLFGDDGKRVFSNAAEGLPSFKEEWETFPALIETVEVMVLKGKVLKPKTAPNYTGSDEAEIAKELAAFEVLEGYEVNLFADESMGVANPLSVRRDADGRMFAACSDVYPQIAPGVMPDDKVNLLDDWNGDGKADRSSVFARGLNIPTGIEVGHDRSDRQRPAGSIFRRQRNPSRERLVEVVERKLIAIEEVADTTENGAFSFPRSAAGGENAIRHPREGQGLDVDRSVSAQGR